MVAAGWSLTHLLAVLNATRHDLPRLEEQVKRGPGVESAAAALEAEGAAWWEAELAGAIVKSGTVALARREVNGILLELGAKLPRQQIVKASCVRVAILGALLGVALLVAEREVGSISLLDVLAMGGAAVLVSWTAGTEAQNVVEKRRTEIDGLVTTMMTARWGPAWAAEPEQSDGSRQTREPRFRRSVDAGTS